MRQLFKLNAACIAALGVLTFVAITTPASAHTYPYCRWDTQMYNCGYDTLAQCQAAASGRANYCARDPFLGWINNVYVYAPGYSRSQRRWGHLNATIENR